METNRSFKVIWEGELSLDSIRWNKYPNKEFLPSSEYISEINANWNRHIKKYPNDYIKLFSDINIRFATIPVQSGSNKILKNMNRKYNISKVIKVIKKIKQVSPKTVIYTHFIIGYPGEKTIVNIQLEHFDTNSSKCILDVFKMLEAIYRAKHEVVINWHYEDEDILEAGEDYKSFTGIPFQMIEIVE